MTQTRVEKINKKNPFTRSEKELLCSLDLSGNIDAQQKQLNCALELVKDYLQEKKDGNKSVRKAHHYLKLAFKLARTRGQTEQIINTQILKTSEDLSPHELEILNEQVVQATRLGSEYTKLAEEAERTEQDKIFFEYKAQEALKRALELVKIHEKDGISLSVDADSNLIEAGRWYTSIRILFLNLNRIIGYFEKLNVSKIRSFLPKWFGFLGLSYGITFMADILQVAALTIGPYFHPETNPDHIPWHTRLYNAWQADGRASRMANDGFWFAANLAGIIITGGLSLIINFIGFSYDVAHEIVDGAISLNDRRKFINKLQAKIDKVKDDSKEMTKVEKLTVIKDHYVKTSSSVSNVLAKLRPLAIVTLILVGALLIAFPPAGIPAAVALGLGIGISTFGACVLGGVTPRVWGLMKKGFNKLKNFISHKKEQIYQFVPLNEEQTFINDEKIKFNNQFNNNPAEIANANHNDVSPPPSPPPTEARKVRSSKIEPIQGTMSAAILARIKARRNEAAINNHPNEIRSESKKEETQPLLPTADRLNNQAPQRSLGFFTYVDELKKIAAEVDKQPRPTT